MVRFVCGRAEMVPGSPIRKMFNKALGMSDVINLGIGEPDFDTPDTVKAAGIQAIRDGRTKYTANAGFLSLRRAIADKLAGFNGVRADPATQVVVTNGAMEALILAMMVTLEPGDEVLVPDPGWPNYVGQMMMCGAVPVPVPVLEENGFAIAARDVEARITGATRAILINTPCNPTGAVTPAGTLAELAELAARRDLVVYADETYERLTYGVPHVSIASLDGMADRVVGIYSFSKSYAMTGWRLGYACGPADVIRNMSKLHENLTACAPSIAQVAGEAALRECETDVRKMREDYRRRRDMLVAGLNSIPGISCRLPDGTFYAFVNVKGLGLPSEEVAEALLERVRVVTVPGIGFGRNGEGYLRMSFAAPQSAIERALERIGDAVRHGILP